MMLSKNCIGGLVKIRMAFIKRTYYSAASNKQLMGRVEALAEECPLFNLFHKQIANSKREYLARYAEPRAKHSFFDTSARSVNILNQFSPNKHIFHEWAHMYSFDAIAERSGECTALQVLEKPWGRLCDEYFACYCHHYAESGDAAAAAKFAAQMIPKYADKYDYEPGSVGSFKDTFMKSKYYESQRKIIEGTQGLAATDVAIKMISEKRDEAL